MFMFFGTKTWKSSAGNFFYNLFLKIPDKKLKNVMVFITSELPTSYFFNDTARQHLNICQFQSTS